ncbi:fatty acyl-CoA hydrolase precursor, medium chain-like isoform X1 [Oncorhynchus clarkii lewisi]|uniref:fatty acyl-CoA hydrolase precursor, medium chain-like isoform X1 n=1 Tax=Oncorhynchus clarkii lewisi TaxID=490388 RepID=UPI0039B8D0B7
MDNLSVTTMMCQGRRVLLAWISLSLFVSFHTVEGDRESLFQLHTSYGQLEGRLVRVRESQRKVAAYLGIPFAEPPVGPLRFQAPRPPRVWQGLRDAKAYPPLCLQNMNHTRQMVDLYGGRFPVLTTSEDCLYLNIYTPVKPGDPRKLPVMIWIHGGGFLMGGASLYDGSSLAAFGDVVVVIIQYRLGIPGFLSTGDGQYPGNVGFLDQVCALRWVQETISSFGGDPGSVTIFGESAGGVAIFLHMMSPLSSGLFHKAISQSGVPLISLFIQDDPKPTAQLVAQRAGCPSDDSAELMTCLSTLSPQDIEAATPAMGDMVLSVHRDGTVIPTNLEEVLQTKSFLGFPRIIGVNNHEYGWMLPHFFLFPGWDLGMTRENMMMILAFMLQELRMPDSALGIIVGEYFGDMKDPVGIRDAFLELMGDLLIVVPGIEEARRCRDAGCLIYYYEFQQRPSMFTSSRPGFVKADHFDEVGFVFGAPFWTDDIVMLDNTTDEERQLSRTMMKYWTNFARTGNPNGENMFDWPTFTTEEECLLIQANLRLGSVSEKKRAQFWTEDFPKGLQTAGHKDAHNDL